MTDRALVSMAQQFSGLPMDSLIGGPLNAAANANAAMAMTQTKFMLDTCFKKVTNESDGNGPTTTYEPILIDMKLTRGVITPAGPDSDAPEGEPSEKTDIQPLVTAFKLPLLTIVPINSLGVDNVDVQFEMEVKSSFSEEQSRQTENAIQASAEWEVKAGWGPVSASVKGSASYDHKDSSTHNTHYEKSNAAKYTVQVHAGQLPVPKGVNTIIEAFSKSIEPITLPAAPEKK